jgi:hypothetical protein
MVHLCSGFAIVQKNYSTPEWIAALHRNEKLRWWRAMNAPRLVGRHPLENGLTLEFWDHSRPVAGDRWFVRLEARIAIALRAETLPPELKAQARAVVEALGKEIIFSHTEERNFIAASEVSGLLKEMQTRMLQLAPGYFGHTDFAARYIRKKIGELRELRQWQDLDTRGGDGA